MGCKNIRENQGRTSSNLLEISVKIVEFFPEVVVASLSVGYLLTNSAFCHNFGNTEPICMAVLLRITQLYDNTVDSRLCKPPKEAENWFELSEGRITEIYLGKV